MTERREIHARVLGDVQHRARWEQRQALWYEMRHTGLRRKSKPWPNAADLHYPLIDTVIDKLKPFYYQQVVGMDVVATFVPMCAQLNAFTVTAERWFDYKIKERSNFQQEALTWIDHGLMSGRSVIKVYWDNDTKRVGFDAIDPMYFIVPPHTKTLEEADRMVHVMRMSVEAFKASPLYDREVLGLIQGDNNSGGEESRKQQEVYSREGITYEADRDKVLVWEVYTRDEDGEWMVHTYSPAAPDVDLREPMKLPYRHGDPPFVDFSYEIKDKGWYSPRGVCEQLAPYEAFLCKLWNEKTDAATMYNRPLFRAEREVPNAANLSMTPGQILPFGIAPVTMPQPPINFDQEMVSTRMVAEQRVAVPDFGIGQMINTNERRTATEVQAVGHLMAQSGDLRARVFRLALARVYRQAWGLLMQFDARDLAYRYLDDTQDVDPVVLHSDYVIEPKGGVDGVNRALKLQQAVFRKQLFGGAPWVDQVELDKSIMELDDPVLVKRLVRDPQFKEQDEAEDEAHKITIMEKGWPARVKPGLDFGLRLQVLLGYLQQREALGEPLSDVARQRIMERVDALLEGYEQVDPNNARALRKELEKNVAPMEGDASVPAA